MLVRERALIHSDTSPGRPRLIIVPMAKITGLNIICSPLSIYHSGIFSNINYALCILVLLVLTFFPILQPQIAKVKVCCLLCFSWFLDC